MSKTQKDLFLEHLEKQINDQGRPETILAYLEIVLPAEGEYRDELKALWDLCRDINQQSELYKQLGDLYKGLKDIDAKSLNLEHFDFESQAAKDRKQRLFRILLAIIGIAGAILSGWIGTIIKDHYENKTYQFCLKLESAEDQTLWDSLAMGKTLLVDTKPITINSGCSEEIIVKGGFRGEVQYELQGELKGIFEIKTHKILEGSNTLMVSRVGVKKGNSVPVNPGPGPLPKPIPNTVVRLVDETGKYINPPGVKLSIESTRIKDVSPGKNGVFELQLEKESKGALLDYVLRNSTGKEISKGTITGFGEKTITIKNEEN